MDNIIYTQGYRVGQMALINAMLQNCEHDLDFLQDQMADIKRWGGAKARHLQEGKLEAVENSRERLLEAKRALERRSIPTEYHE